MRSLINMLWDERKLIEDQIKKLDLELERISAADAGCTRIRQIPGIGPLLPLPSLLPLVKAPPSIRAETSPRDRVSCRAPVLDWR